MFESYTPSQNKKPNKLRVMHGVLITTLVFALSACEQKEQVKKTTPVAAVSVYQITTSEAGDYREFVARTQAYRKVEIKSRVEGELLKRHFNEGSFVNAGQVLLEIDPAEYQAGLYQAQADVKSKQAGADGAQRDLKRGRQVADQGYISQSDLDKLITNAAKTSAAVKEAKAALQKASLNLSYTKITAPFSGKIGKVNYNVGNIVGPQSNTLATLTSIDPIYVIFQVEEAEYITYLQKNKNIKTSAEVPLNLALRLPNDSQYAQMGKIDFADTKVDHGTGTVELRAVFANPDGIVVPGLFVTLIFESQDKKQMASVPQAAVQKDQQGKFVLVVGEDNKVVIRYIKLGRRINAMWLVETGLNHGEKVIIEGLQKVRQGVEVKPIAKSVDPMTGTVSALNQHQG